MLAEFPEIAGNIKETMECPRALVGRLIGSRGDIVREIQFKSKVRGLSGWVGGWVDE